MSIFTYTEDNGLYRASMVVGVLVSQENAGSSLKKLNDLLRESDWYVLVRETKNQDVNLCMQKNPQLLSVSFQHESDSLPFQVARFNLLAEDMRSLLKPHFGEVLVAPTPEALSRKAADMLLLPKTCL